MKMKQAQESDISGIQKMRIKSIKALGIKSYDKTQVKAWASKEVDGDGLVRDIERSNVFIFTEKGEVEGYLQMKSSARPGTNASAYIEGIYVSKAFSGKGFGTKLLKKAEETALANGIYQVKATVSKNAEPFFVKHGYEILGPSLRRTIDGQVLEFQPLFKGFERPDKKAK
jgi:putative acetyltransferase